MGGGLPLCPPAPLALWVEGMGPCITPNNPIAPHSTHVTLYHPMEMGGRLFLCPPSRSHRGWELGPMSPHIPLYHPKSPRVTPYHPMSPHHITPYHPMSPLVTPYRPTSPHIPPLTAGRAPPVFPPPPRGRTGAQRRHAAAGSQIAAVVRGVAAEPRRRAAGGCRGSGRSVSRRGGRPPRAAPPRRPAPRCSTGTPCAGTRKRSAPRWARAT